MEAVYPGHGADSGRCDAVKDWMEPFLEECLAGVPASGYRERLKGELAGHLEELEAELEESGLPPERARRLALERMGEPPAVGRACREEFLRRRSMEPGWCAGRLWRGCLLMGGLYLLTFVLLSALGVTYDASFPGRRTFHMCGDPVLTAAVGCTLFFLPFGGGAWFLARSFPFHPRRGVVVTAGLLLAWLGEKLAILSLSAAIYGLWNLPALLERISGGGDPTAPWFTLPYLLLTLLGCPLLGRAAVRLERSAARG